MTRLKTRRDAFAFPAEVVRLDRPHSGDEDHEVIDIRNLANVVWRGRWIIGLAALGLAVLAAVLVSRIEASYRASATVMFGEVRPSLAGFEGLFSDRAFQSRDLENEIQILTSTTLLARVVEDLGLQHDPFFNPDATAAEPDETGATSLANPPLDRFGLAPDAFESPTTVELGKQNAVTTIREHLQLTPVKDSAVIQLSFEAPSAAMAAGVANAIVDQYVVDQLQVKLDAARAATDWLTARVEDLRQKTQASEEAVEALRAQLAATAGQGIEITQQQLAATNAELSAARGAAATNEARLAWLSQALQDGRDLSSESPLIRSYRDEEATLMARRDTLSANHPAIPQLEVQIKAVRDRIEDEAQRVAASAEVASQTAETRVRELERAVHDLESRALAQSRDEIRIRQLEREAQANRLLYENLLTRLTETSDQDGLETADARILSPAEFPTEPVSRNAPVMVVVAALAGAFLAAGYVVAREHFNNTFRTPRQIEEATGLPVLAALPALSGRRNRDLVEHLVRKPSSSLAEAVRNLRTSILQSNSERTPRVIMFTSSIPGEGKSSTSMLTGITSRQMGKSAVILDCDLRLSSTERILGIGDSGPAPGVLSVLEGSASLDEALYEDPRTGLHVLMARRGERSKERGNAADILASRAFAELVGELSRRYELVILDTPPVLVVTDARIIAGLADAVVYVVRWGSTPRDAVVEGLKEMRSARVPLAGIVLSMIDEKRAANSIVDGYTHHRGRHHAYFET